MKNGCLEINSVNWNVTIVKTTGIKAIAALISPSAIIDSVLILLPSTGLFMKKLRQNRAERFERLEIGLT